MGKRFKGKLCAYCAVAIADTEEHVFPRALFLPADRSELPKAPACRSCNQRKAKLDHYAATVLPFGARHLQAQTNLVTMVPGRLKNNQALHRKLRKNAGRIWVQEGSGVIVPTMVFPVDGMRLKVLLEYIAKGLIWHHSGAYLSAFDVIDVRFLTTEEDERLKREVFAPRIAHRIAVTLGNGTIAYEGLQASDGPQCSVWRISFYGGVNLSSGNAADGISNTIAVFTSRNAATQ
jgi:hypothetical protein